MSFFGTPSTASANVQKVSTLQVQTSSYGVALPRAWGTTRMAGNLIWFGDFKATEQRTDAGGKGGGGSMVTGYTYRAAVMFGLCDNPITDVPRTWVGKEKYLGHPANTDFSTGALDQPAWAYLASNGHAGEALRYPGLAWFAASSFSLGSSGSMATINFEVQTTSAGIVGTPDAAPWQVVQDILADVGYPSSRLGSLTAYANFCGAYGIFLSPLMDQQGRAAEQIAGVLEASCTAPVFSEGRLKLIPYGDTAKSANGYTFTPSVSPIFALTDDDFLPVEGEALPIRVTRRASSDAKNSLRVEYKDRALEYATATVEAQDDAHIAQFGRRPGETKSFDGIKTAAVATTVAWLTLQRGLYTLNTYEFRLPWRYCQLEPMDIVTLTHAGLGMDAVPVRILSVDDGPDGALDVSAEDFAQGAGLAPLVAPQPATGYSLDTNVAPGSATAPVIYEPPLLLSGQPEIWLATAGGPAYGGCDVWVSSDGSTYQRVGTLSGKSRYGTATLANGSGLDGANTLAVDLTLSGGSLIGGTADDRDLFRTLCVVGGELVSYRDATLTAANRYNLASLRRGAYGSPAGAHAAGSPFVRLDDRVFRYAYDPAMVGRQLYIKLQAFNIHGNAYQDLATLTPITYTVQGYPPPAVVDYAGSVSADGTRVHTWSTAASVPAGTVCEIRYSASSGTAWADMALVGQAPYGAGRLEVQTPAAGTWTVEARLRDRFGVVSAAGARATVTLTAAPSASVGAGNLLPSTDWSSGSFAPVVMGWNPGAFAPLALRVDDTWRPAGGQALELTRQGRSGNAYNIGADVYLTGGYGSRAFGIPVVAGQRYEVSGKLASHRCDSMLVVDFFDANDSFLPGAGTGWVARASGGRALSGWTHAAAFVTAPAGAAYASVYWRCSDTDVGQADCYAWLTEPVFKPAAVGQTAPSPYVPGSSYALALAIARANLAETQAKAYADGVVDAEEARAIADATAKANAAQAAAAADATAKANVAATTATWAGVSGAGKPQDNATVGAQFGVNISGQITAGTAGTYVADKALGTPQLADYAATATYKSTAGQTLMTAPGFWTTTNLIIVGAQSAVTVEIEYTGVLGRVYGAGPVSLDMMVQYKLTGAGQWVDMLPAAYPLAYNDAVSSTYLVLFSYADLLTVPAGSDVYLRVNVRSNDNCYVDKTIFKVAVIKK